MFVFLPVIPRDPLCPVEYKGYAFFFFDEDVFIICLPHYWVLSDSLMPSVEHA